jgi:hypothetical protein
MPRHLKYNDSIGFIGGAWQADRLLVTALLRVRLRRRDVFIGRPETFSWACMMSSRC